MLAARGACDMGSGVQNIQDAGLRQAINEQARQVWRAAGVLALTLTGLSLLLSRVI